MIAGTSHRNLSKSAWELELSIHPQKVFNAIAKYVAVSNYLECLLQQ